MSTGRPYRGINTLLLGMTAAERGYLPQGRTREGVTGQCAWS
jgi:antirestriction protein ArdC